MLLVILLIGITSGCVSGPENEFSSIVLPPMPQREELPPPPPELIEGSPQEAIEWAAAALSYYDSLVSLWESWGQSAVEIAHSK